MAAATTSCLLRHSISRSPILPSSSRISFSTKFCSVMLLHASRCFRPLRGHAIPKLLSNRSFILTLRLSTFLIHPRRFMCRIAASANEEAAAKAAAMTADSGAPTIFDKIIAKEIPSSIVYEDEKVLAFRDINPQAPINILIIPKIRDGLAGLGKIVAEKEGIEDGFRVVINNGPEACQSVYHLHLHVLGRRQLKWPPG